MICSPETPGTILPSLTIRSLTLEERPGGFGYNYDAVEKAQEERSCPMKPAAKPLLYIPYEIGRREFHGRLLIAVEAAARGFRVFFGHKSKVDRLALRNMSKGGIYFSKAVPRPQDRVPNSLARAGFRIVAQEEETNYLQTDYRDWFQSRPSTAFAGDLDRFFCWGTDEYSFLKEHTIQREGSVVLTGSPRTCFWGDLGRQYFGDEIESIQNGGRWLVFVSNFASGNSIFSARQHARYESRHADMDRQKALTQVAEDRANFDTALEYIRDLNSLNKWPIIIRTHPSESKKNWLAVVKANPGMLVSEHGDISPFVLGADIVVHSGSSVGAQAAISGVPTFTIRPSNSKPNLSVDVSGEIGDLLADPEAAVISQRARDYSREITNKFVFAGTANPPRLIVDELLALPVPETTLGRAQWSLVFRATLAFVVSQILKSNSKSHQWIPIDLRLKLNKEEYVSLSAIRSWVEKALRLLELPSTVQANKLCEGIFRIE